ncbi:DNA primase [Muricomes sp. OA1]|uniref:DNA primase n=1 Tax=Hungatella hathewayi TaxID=154046 RepID=A0A3E2WWV5_9FIRM|nr:MULTISPECIES: DNA primase [Clostridia]MCH1974202.1 DNA primase [Muricomes sp. OA1]MRM88054.1 DNA primase [Faecalicatena contorta]RGC32429.1 DNA primase [Hungatella hathewayi]GKH32975.1 DNA primase [Faecalicatena contorta]
MYYPEELIEEVRMKNDIVDVISGYVRLQKKGSSYFGLCPFHNEKSPSFSVSRGKQMYYCFGCGAGGNVFTFLMEYENFSFIEAVKFLADRAGVELPEMEYSKEAKEKADLRAMLLEINKAAAQYFYVQLKSEQGKAAYTYLRNRELSDDTVKAFGLGYSNKYSNDLFQYLRKKGYSEDLIRQAGLINTDEKNGVYDKFWNRVMFPIMDVNNRVIGFGGRVMGDGKPKYLNSPETAIFDKSRNLYGLNRARTSRKPYFLICEGYMDVISLHQAGFTNAVASLGTALTTGHASLIKRYVQEVYLTYDSDEAGTKAALRAVPILKEAGISAKVIRMDPYKDPDEFIKNLGAEEFEKRIGSARNGFLFSLEILAKDYDMESPEGKTAFFKETAKRLTGFEDELERNNYIEAVAKAYKVSEDSLQKLVTKTAISEGMAKPAARPRQASGGGKPKENGILVSQKILLTWMIEDEKLFGTIKRYISPEDFTEELYRTVAELLYEQYGSGELNPAKILNHFTAEEEHREAASLFHTKIRELSTKEEQEQALKETILRVKRHSIDDRTMHLDPTDMAGLQRLMEEKRRLDDIKKLHISIE